MNNRILTFLMKGIIGRWFFIILNLITMIFELYCIKFIIYEIMKSNTKEIATSKSVISSFMNKLLSGDKEIAIHGVEHINITLNGIGAVLISLGVLMESRETITRMTKTKMNELQEYLNDSAEYCGMGLLLVGLFIEIFAVIIEVPNNLVNTVGIENYLYSVCVILIILSIIIKGSFIKDYLLTYFNKKHNAN